MTESKSSKKRLSRRQLVSGLACIGAGVGLGWNPAFGQSMESSMIPRRGGKIRVASISSSTADTLDPARGALSTDYIRHYMLYSGLTRFDGQLNALPALAESMETEDNIHWQVQLKTGVEFHDGKPFGPDDVIYSLMRHKDPAVSSRVAAVAEQFESVRQVGPNQLEIKLVSANADLPTTLAVSHFLIVPHGESEFRSGNGTGPYQLKEFVPGVRTTVERNGTYWREGRPYLDEIELIGISDEQSRVNALLAGDIHLVLAVNPRSVRRINNSRGYAVLESPSGLYTNLVMRADRYPGSNPDFVEAIKYLFDRELIKRALFRGYATVANDHPVPPWHKYYANDLPVREYDPDRALYHLQQAGMVGARFPVFCSPAASGSTDIATLLQLTATEVDLKLGVNRVPADGYWSNHWMKHPLGFSNINPRPNLDLLFSLFYKSDAPWNESGWNSPQFDQLLLAARGETDEQSRRQMYVDMQHLVSQKCGIGIPVFISIIDGFDSRLKGLGTIPTGGLMGYSFADHVWWEG